MRSSLRRASGGRLIPDTFSMLCEGGFGLRREGASNMNALGLVDLARRRRRQPSSRRARVLLDAGPIKHGELARLLDLRGGRHLGLVLGLVSVVARRERCRREFRFLAVPRRLATHTRAQCTGYWSSL